MPDPTNQQLEGLYYILKLLGDRCKEAPFREVIARINSEVVEREM